MPINYKEYPPNWHSEVRPRIMRRAGEERDENGVIIREAQCERCGAYNHAPHPQTRSPVVITIAHLDHDHTNHSVTDERLQALCQRCHLNLDRPRHMYKRKYGRAAFDHPKLFFH